MRKLCIDRYLTFMKQVLIMIPRVVNPLRFLKWYKINYIMQHMDIQQQKLYMSVRMPVSLLWN